ncbi:hypothetical protein, partial [Methanobrevibacter sp.]
AIMLAGSNCSVVNSSFTGNKALIAGAIYITGTYSSVVNSNFIGNYANYSGSIVIYAPNATIFNSSFVENNATNSSAIGIFAENCSVVNSSFIGNYADCGGVIGMYYANGGVVNSTFVENKGTNCSAICIFAEKCKVVDSSFIGNNASIGGAIYIIGPNSSVVNSTFTANNAINGSAIFFEGNNLAVTNVTFFNNTAESGAGIFNKGQNLKVTYSTFRENTAHDGTNNIALWPGATVTVDEYTIEHSDGPIILKFTNLHARAVNITYGAEGIIVAIIYSNNSYVDRGTLSVVINGKIYNGDVVDGIGIINLKNLNAGAYNDVIVKYLPNDVYASSTSLVNFTVAPQSTSITAPTASFIVNYGGKYKVTVNTKVAGAKVSFVLGGVNMGSAISDAKGVASITLTAAKMKKVGVGVKILVATFPGNNNYNSSVANAKITIKKEASKFTNVKSVKSFYKANAKSMQLTATLKDSKNKVMKSKVVIFKINNKKTYKVKTNSKGVAILTLNSAKIKACKLNKIGRHKFTVTFNADAYYNKASGKGSLKVVK